MPWGCETGPGFVTLSRLLVEMNGENIQDTAEWVSAVAVSSFLVSG